MSVSKIYSKLTGGNKNNNRIYAGKNPYPVRVSGCISYYMQAPIDFISTH
jgi:hypothetical protein